MIRQHFRRLKSWRSRLNFVIKHGVTQQEHKFMQNHQYWNCCAVGENRKILETKGYKFKLDDIFTKLYSPTNVLLYNLGFFFSTCVNTQNYKSALEVLTQIESFPVSKK